MHFRRVVDVLGFVSWLTLAACLLLLLPSVFLGLGLLGVKVGLMIVGILLVGYALLLLKPVRPGEEPDSAEVQSPNDEGAFDGLPPWRWYPIPVEERVDRGFKLAAAGGTMLAVSYLMETVLGIHV